MIASDRPAAPSGPDISVVVCTHHRPEKLTACLEALAGQTIRHRVELILVDDGPDERTAQVASRYAVRFIRHDRNRGLAAARNTGIRAATAPIIAFTDDDCVPSTEWLEQLLAAYEHDAVIGAGGSVRALQRTTLLHRYLDDTTRLAPLESELNVSSSILYRGRLYLRRNLRGGEARPAVRPVYSLVGANMSFRRDVLLAIGLFDDRIHFGGEDEDICRRLRERYPAGELIFTAQATIAHDYDGELRDTLRRSYQYGAGSARSFLKNEQQNPTLFPAPVLVLCLALVGWRRRWGWGAAVLVPFVLCARWPIDAVRRQRAGMLAYPWIQMLEEAAHDIGFGRGWMKLRRAYADPSDSEWVSPSVDGHDDDHIAVAAG